MIRINLLGQIRPKAARRPVDTGAALPVLFIGAGLLLGVLVLGFFYYTWQKQLNAENAQIKQLHRAKDRAGTTQAAGGSVREAEDGSAAARVDTIEQLQRDRTGGQELLDMVANTVSRTENLWLTAMIAKGNTLTIDGSSASINAVANFITALKRSGYFQKVEIKESKQDEKNTARADLHISRLLQKLRPARRTQAESRPARRRPRRRARRRKDRGAPWPIRFEICR